MFLKRPPGPINPGTNRRHSFIGHAQEAPCKWCDLSIFSCLAVSCAHHKFSGQHSNWNAVLMASSNGNIFRVSGHRWIPRTKATDAGFCYFFDLPLNRQLGEQCRRWWFETLPCSLWRHCNVWWNLRYWLHPKLSFFTSFCEASKK